MQGGERTTTSGLTATVTGGSGFIGSEVISQLLSQGIRVRALLRKTSPRHNLQGLDYDTVIGDLNDPTSLRKAVEGSDYVFHLAGTIFAHSREEFFRHNAIGTGNLARACAEAAPGLKRFVYVSSLAASGPAASLAPRVEEDPVAPISVYGESKLGGEHELLRWADSYPTTIVRPPAVYGPRDKAILELVKIVNSGVVPVFPAKNGTGEKYLSLIHVEDLVRGIVLAGLAPGQERREVFFLSGDGVFTWSEVFGAMAEDLGKKPFRIAIPSVALTGLAAAYSAASWALQKSFPLNLDKLRELRRDYWICSNDRAKRVLGFQPRWNMRQGVTHTISWYKQNGWV
jgi:nucleoside-diphosphate-sugar epimerase